MYVYICIYISFRNNFVPLNSIFCGKMATQIVNLVAICSNRVVIIIIQY